METIVLAWFAVAAAICIFTIAGGAVAMGIEAVRCWTRRSDR